jgi:hypothetical protein
MEPGSKGCLAAKSADLAKELHEDILRQIFSLSYVPGHAQAEAVHATMVTLVKFLKSRPVTLGSKLHISIYRNHCRNPPLASTFCFTYRLVH